MGTKLKPGGRVLSEGAHVGNYAVEAFLGSGGMSSVYRARHRVLNSLHAVKVLNPELGRSDALRERFLQEGQVLAQVRHPGLVRVTDVVDEGLVAGLVMDLLEGEDLAERLRRGAIPVGEAAGIALQVLSALEHAHREGVVHRDLKPGNIFLVDRGSRKPALATVLDFGIAKLRGSELTRGTSTMGTVSYMSPEQIEHPGEVDARSDLFSLGVVLFEMVAGVPAFPGDTDFAIMQRIVAGEQAHLAEGAGPLAPVVAKALQSDPDQRYPTAAAFAHALRPFAPPDVRLMVDEWEGTGGLERPAGGLRPAAAPPSPPPPTEAGPPAVVDPLAGLELQRMTDREVVRLAGSLQLVSGVFNLTVMSFVQCFGLGWLGGLPMCFGVLLFVVGGFESAVWPQRTHVQKRPLESVRWRCLR